LPRGSPPQILLFGWLSVNSSYSCVAAPFLKQQFVALHSVLVEQFLQRPFSAHEY
jgi:hypothetical protein